MFYISWPQPFSSVTFPQEQNHSFIFCLLIFLPSHPTLHWHRSVFSLCSWALGRVFHSSPLPWTKEFPGYLHPWYFTQFGSKHFFLQCNYFKLRCALNVSVFNWSFIAVQLRGEKITQLKSLTYNFVVVWNIIQFRLMLNVLNLTYKIYVMMIKLRQLN